MTTSMNKKIVFIGLGKMGEALVKNLSDNDYCINAYDKSNKQRLSIQEKNINNVSVKSSLKDLFDFGAGPKIVLISVPEGNNLDNVFISIRPFLAAGDLIIDCGNSYFKNTLSRKVMLKKYGIDLLDFGISGGPSGAREGPAIMTGCDSKSLWNSIKSLALSMSKSRKNVSFRVGKTGSGHFVKMIHNSIEYAVMQLISELILVVSMMNVGSKDKDNIIDKINNSLVGGYLFDISSQLLSKEQDIHTNIKVNHNGTGVWASMFALENDISIPTIARAIEHRLETKINRVYAGKLLIDIGDNKNRLKINHIDSLISCFELSFVSAFLQGMSLLGYAEKHLESKVDPSQVISLWMDRSVLRGNLLKESRKFNQEIYLRQNMELCENFTNRVRDFQVKSKSIFKRDPWIVSICPCLFSGINYIYNTKSKIRISHTINTQRKTFGGHTINSE